MYRPAGRKCREGDELAAMPEAVTANESIPPLEEAMRSSSAATRLDRRVDVAALRGEEVCHVVSVFEDEGGGLVDGDRAGSVLGVGVPPACSARVRKPKVCSAIGLLLVYLPAGDGRGESIVARLYTVPPAASAPSAGTYVSFIADYDGASYQPS